MNFDLANDIKEADSYLKNAIELRDLRVLNDAVSRMQAIDASNPNIPVALQLVRAIVVRHYLSSSAF
jgi:hypothetical protein